MFNKYRDQVDEFRRVNFESVPLFYFNNSSDFSEFIEGEMEGNPLSGFLILIHKGSAFSNDSRLYSLCLGRSEVIFSNKLYVLFNVRDLTMEDDCIKRFYWSVYEEFRRAEFKSENQNDRGFHQDILENINKIFRRIPEDEEPEETEESQILEQSDRRFCQYVGNDEILTETYFGRKIFLDARDVSLTPHIAYEGRWEQWVTDFLVSRMRPGQTFIDIGANCGFFAIAAAHVIGRDGAVVAFEPQKNLASLLDRSFWVNGFESFCSVVESAIGDVSGTAELGHHREFKGVSSLVPEFMGPGTGERAPDVVKIETLDEALRKESERLGRKLEPDLIKIDAEGYEVRIFRGMQGILRSDRPLTILLEFLPKLYLKLGDDPVEFVASFYDYGFQVERLQADGQCVPFTTDDVEIVIAEKSYVDLVLTRP